MNILTTFSEKSGPDSAKVYWHLGAEKNGVLEVLLPYTSNDSDIIGELVAINYLATEKHIFGNEVLHGSGINLNVSKGAIKKILAGKSAKKEVVKYASFIPFMMYGVTVQTHKKRGEAIGVDESCFEKIDVDVEKYTNTKLMIDTPAIGPVEITAHALNRYIERIKDESGELKHPLRSLVNRLSNPDNYQVDLPEKVRLHKLKKYGDDGSFTVWKHPTSTLNYGLIQKGDKHTLVTVFINKQ